MLTVPDIKRVIGSKEYEFYGIRVDKVKYIVGDIAHNSHQLLQDPDFDENGELIYPYVGDGLYDAGELNGTSTIGFQPDDESIKFALEQINHYHGLGDYVHILGGDYAECGNDTGEIIISNAEVLEVYEK